VTRIVAGLAGGRRLQVPPGRRTRPTSERAREGLFSSLGDLSGLRFLDLFAGSGAVGLEALSRGAAHATLVEADPMALRVLRANVTALGLPGADVRPVRVERFLADWGGGDSGLDQRGPEERGGPAGAALDGAGYPLSGTYDVAFLDPPYAHPVDEVLARIVPLVDDRVVVERATRDGAPTWPAGLTGGKARRYGDTTLWYGQRS
jgi:16S rRNA (guanine966-N2)-methyltransferase